MKTNFLLRLFLGLVFLSAGTYRIFYWQNALAEISNLKLPFAGAISVAVILLEIIGGLMLIFNIQTKKILLAFIIFLAATLIWSLIISGKTLLGNIPELFTFNLTPTDIFLHFTYLIILAYLFFGKKI